MRLAILVLFSLVSSLTCAPHLINKRQAGYGSSGAPVIGSFPQPAAGLPGAFPTGLPMATAVTAPAFAAGAAGIAPAYLSGYGNGLSLGMAAFGNVGAGLGIGGLGVGGPLLNRIPGNSFGGGFGAVGPAGLPGVGAAGFGGAGFGGAGFGGAELAGAELAGLGGAGGPYVPGDFGVGPLEMIGPYSLGGIYGPYGWNGLGGRAAQWGIEFGPWDYPFLRLQRFEDMLDFNRNLNCQPGAAFNIMCQPAVTKGVARGIVH